MTTHQERYIDQFRRTVNRYAPVTDESFAELLAITQVRILEKNECLLPVGQVAVSQYYVCAGVLMSVFLTDDGGEHVKNFFTEGNFAGSTASSLRFAPSAFAIQSLKEAVVLEYNFQQYKQLINQREDLKLFYIAYLEQSWILKNEPRQIAFATQTATTRYQAFRAEHPDLVLRIPLHHIASYLGITPTQLSRIRKTLRE